MAMFLVLLLVRILPWLQVNHGTSTVHQLLSDPSPFQVFGVDAVPVQAGEAGHAVGANLAGTRSRKVAGTVPAVVEIGAILVSGTSSSEFLSSRSILTDTPVHEHVAFQAGSTVLALLAFACSHEVSTEDLDEVLAESGAVSDSGSSDHGGGFNAKKLDFSMDNHLWNKRGGVDADGSHSGGKGVGDLYGWYGS